ncbi:MAG TPA: serine/threonine-protein kinase [Candidatus Polarisedimenticolia bacterium]|nr:serine/threonine-protein kinase [Candidatus Polarisedimenticolia bacterium]
MADPDRCSTCGGPLASEGATPPICIPCAFTLALKEVADGAPDAADGPIHEAAAVERIGPYRLERILGEGGMGVVWQAAQEEPVRRQVALKRLKLGMDSAQVLARFESERQALALMSHAHIAQVFDAGRTPQGQPYFAMEYVDGTWLTRHCDAGRLTVSQRLDLFLLVCEAIQHAHQKGVIHRDIKPSNILVQTGKDRPTPKVIDFGVAKAIGAHLTERTLVTQIGQTIGTPEYMSPEQSGPAGFDVDTRTDVYALGVVLYELLTGRLPFEAPEGDPDELRRRIREDEPKRPSVRVAGSGPEDADVARARGTDPAGLARRLRGDLDWITLKALAKDRAQRYGSAEDLAEDLRRHLAGLPVLAGPPTAAYRMSKFVRRHLVAVAAGSTMLLLLATTAVGMTIQAGRVARERDRANQEAKTAGAALEFLTDIFQLSDPEQARGETITAREILDKGARDVERDLKAAPDVQARLILAIGRSYKNLGLYDRAEPLVRKAVGLRQDRSGPRVPGRLEASLELADILRIREEYDDAEATARDTLRALEATVGADDPETANAHLVLGDTLFDRGRYDEAEPHLRTALDVWTRTLGPEDRRTLHAAALFGYFLSDRGRYDEADALLRRALEDQRRAFGADSPHSIIMLTYLAQVSLRRGQLSEGEAQYREALGLARRVFGEDHLETHRVAYSLGRHLLATERLDEAEALIGAALAGRRRLLGPRHQAVFVVLADWGSVQLNRGHLEEAEKAVREALDGVREISGEDHPQTLRLLNLLSIVLKERGRLEEAETYARSALEGNSRVFGPAHTYTLTALGNLGYLIAQRGRHTEALPLLEEALQGQRKALPARHLNIGITLSKYGYCLVGLRRFEEAEAALLEAHDIVLAEVGASHNQAQGVIKNLIALYETWGKGESAARWRAARTSV